MPLGSRRKQPVQRDVYKAVASHFFSLGTAEIAGSRCDSMQRLALGPS